MNPYLIDTPISNNIHKKICQKTYKNPQKKKLIHIFKYKDICFYGLIDLILLKAYYIGAY
jgi:hypothetical protein